MHAEPNPAGQDGVLSDGDLVLHFESLGDNCELGMVQRLVGVEPLGLLRFANAPVGALIHALRARFDGLAAPANVAIEASNGEYMVRLRKYGMVYHADAKIGAADPQALYQQQTRTLPFLVNKLIGDLECAEKLLVFRQNEPLAAVALIELRAALHRYGPSTLLWVQAARPGRPAGTVDRIDDSLLVGYVRRLADRANVPDLDLGSWLAMLRRAHFVWRARPAPAKVPTAATEPAAIDIVFGTVGNARAYIGEGWSPPNVDYIWAIDDRSVLTFAPPASAATYRLEMDVRPFVRPPALESHVFDPLEPGIAVCEVPGALIAGHAEVKIVLEHPHAARPCDFDGDGDDRRLAVMFLRLTLAPPSDPPSLGPPPLDPPPLDPPAPVPAEPRTETELLFGSSGNADASPDLGWAIPDSDFTWAVDDRSLVSIAAPAEAPNYRLELDVTPFEQPPAVTTQRLDIMVNGTFVRAFDPLPRGVSACVVPGRLINGRDLVDILLTHPRAARPADLGIGTDTRRLAIMVRRIWLAGLPE